MDKKEQQPTEPGWYFGRHKSQGGHVSYVPYYLQDRGGCLAIDRLNPLTDYIWLGPCRPEDAQLRQRIEKRIEELKADALISTRSEVDGWLIARSIGELRRLLEPEERK